MGLVSAAFVCPYCAKLRELASARRGPPGFILQLRFDRAIHCIGAYRNPARRGLPSLAARANYAFRVLLSLLTHVTNLRRLRALVTPEAYLTLHRQQVTELPGSRYCAQALHPPKYGTKM